MTKLLVFIFTVTLTLQCLSQSKSILVYSAKEDFLITKIEKYLKQLKYPEDGKVFFSSVTNLNQITSNIASETALREIVDFYSKQYFELNEDAKNKYELVTSELLKNDFFLIVNSNLIYDAIEYQFYLYKIDKADLRKTSTKNLFPTTNPISPLKTENFLINTKDEKKYIELQTAVARLFPSVNISPIAEISLHSEIQKHNDYYYVSLNDTLILFSDNSIDVDTEKENWQYYWRQIDLAGKLNIDNTSLVNMDKRKQTAKVSFRKEGTYKFGLKIFDGVSYSKEDTALVKVIKPPKLYLLSDKLVNIGSSSLLIKKPTKKNKGIALISGNKNWDLIIRKSNIVKQDTFDLLENFYHWRKHHEDIIKIRGHENFKKFHYRTDTIKDVNRFIFGDNQFSLNDSTVLIPEGLEFYFPFDKRTLREIDLEFYLEKNGVKSNFQKMKVINKSKSSTSISIDYLMTRWELIHNNQQINNLPSLLSFNEISFKLSLGLTSSISTGIGHSFIHEPFLSNTINSYFSSRLISANELFASYSINSFLPNEESSVTPIVISSFKVYWLDQPFYQFQPRVGFLLSFYKSLPIEFYVFGGYDFSLTKVTNDSSFNPVESESFNVGIRFTPFTK